MQQETATASASTARRTAPPFRADHVGSLLRPKRLLQARDDFAAGRIDAVELRGVEDDAIREIVRKQEEIGFQSATDGEFRRASWHMDFIYQLDGITKEAGHIAVKFYNADGAIEFTPAALHVDGKLGVSKTIFGDDFRFLQQTVTMNVPKLTIPSPSMVHYRGGKAAIDPANELEVDGFLMEWDDERSGGFEPLRFLPKGEKHVVLGLVTTKRGELESKDALKRRIEEASKFAPLEQLCLSPQCGFSSTVEGNVLGEDEQWAKLRLIVELAEEVWG